MSNRLMVYFKPEDVGCDLNAIYSKAVKNLEGFAPKLNDEIIDMSVWGSFLAIPDFKCDILYLYLFIWGHCSIISNNMECREYIKRVCTAFGADEWWYSSEMEYDELIELSQQELYEVFISKTVEYEEYLSPDFVRKESLLLVHDDVHKHI